MSDLYVDHKSIPSEAAVKVVTQSRNIDQSSTKFQIPSSKGKNNYPLSSSVYLKKGGGAPVREV